MQTAFGFLFWAKVDLSNSIRFDIQRVRIEAARRHPSQVQCTRGVKRWLERPFVFIVSKISQLAAAGARTEPLIDSGRATFQWAHAVTVRLVDSHLKGLPDGM